MDAQIQANLCMELLECHAHFFTACRTPLALKRTLCKTFSNPHAHHSPMHEMMLDVYLNQAPLRDATGAARVPAGVHGWTPHM